MLTEPELRELLQQPSYVKKYVSCRQGSMQVRLHGHTFEFVCNRSGNHYYRCVHNADEPACLAKILVRGTQVYVIDGGHNHEAPADDASDAAPSGGGSDDDEKAAGSGVVPPSMSVVPIRLHAAGGGGAVGQQGAASDSGPSLDRWQIVVIDDEAVAAATAAASGGTVGVRPRLLNKQAAASSAPSGADALKARMTSKLQRLQLLSKQSKN